MCGCTTIEQPEFKVTVEDGENSLIRPEKRPQDVTYIQRQKFHVDCIPYPWEVVMWW